VIVRGTEGGQSWTELAALDPLAGVLDPADTRGGKNRLIDRAHKRALGRAAGDLGGLRVLDFGCGTARLSEWLVRRGATVDGVDVTPEMLAVARTRVPGARFHETDGTTLPFDEGRFDLAVTAYVLQYYVRTASPIPGEIARVLRAGGRLLAIEQITDSDIGRGGTSAQYERTLAAAGLDVDATSVVRTSDSRLVGIASGHPFVSRLPFVPLLVNEEARRRANAPLTDGRYADALFSATRRS
jgi:SAM-dependent methyltransferase